MQFALNYSPQAADALRDGALRIDRFKCPPWDDLTAEARIYKPIYIHFPLRTGALHKADWYAIERWMRDTDTPKVNVHLQVRAEDVAGASSTPDADFSAQVETVYRRDLETLTARFGAGNIVAENVPYGRKTEEKHILQASIDPALITRALDASGCGLLLDVSHATLTAFSLGIDALDYIAALPLERAGEVHLTGIREIDGVRRDHVAFTEPDFVRAEAALRLIKARGGNPWIVSCEYGGIGEKFEWRSEYDVIVHDCARLNTILTDVAL